MQVSRLIYTIFAKFPNKTPPSSQTELCQTAERIVAKLRNEIASNCGKVTKIFAHINYFYYLCSVFQK